MDEKWKPIKNFPGYEVSNTGKVRSYYQKRGRNPSILVDTPTIMKTSDDGNGYQKLMLYSRIDGKRYCKKVHRLVAEAFIPHSPEDDTVDHIKSGPLGKLNNSVDNLRWIPRSDNIKKAYLDGVCDDRINSQLKPIMCTNLDTREETYYPSINSAASDLGIDRSSISHVLLGDNYSTSRYTFEYAGREERLLYGHEGYEFVS